MKYLCFLRHPEQFRDNPPPAALMEAMGPFVTEQMKSGVLVDTGGLLPSKDGLRIRSSGGKISVTDGPFTESKEVIGGWAIMQGTREDVLKASTAFMELHRKHWPELDCESEVRPMFEPNHVMQPGDR